MRNIITGTGKPGPKGPSGERGPEGPPGTGGRYEAEHERRVIAPLDVKFVNQVDACDFGAHGNADTIAQWVRVSGGGTGQRSGEVNGGTGYPDLTAVRQAYPGVQALTGITMNHTIDWLAIQHAIVVAHARRAEVLLPPGTYRIAHGLRCHGREVRLRGAGKRVTVIEPTTTNFDVIGNSLATGANRCRYLSLQDVTVRGSLGLAGNWSEAGDASNALVKCGEVEEIEIDRCLFERGRHFGLSFKGARKVRIADSDFYMVMRDVISLNDCADVDVSACTFTHSRDDAIANHDAEGDLSHPGVLRVRGCRFRDCYGVRAHGASRIVIQGNVFEAVLHHAIEVTQAYNGIGDRSQASVVITDNVISDVLRPIHRGENDGSPNEAFGIYVSQRPLQRTGTFPASSYDEAVGWQPGKLPYPGNQAFFAAGQPFFGTKSVVIANNVVGRYFPSGVSVRTWKSGGYATLIQHPVTGQNVPGDSILPYGLLRKNVPSGSTYPFQDFTPTENQLAFPAITLRGPLFDFEVVGNVLEPGVNTSDDRVGVGVHLNAGTLDQWNQIEAQRFMPIRGGLIADNQFTNFTVGIDTQGASQPILATGESLPADLAKVQVLLDVDIRGNQFAGDPYRTHPRGNANGTWGTSGVDCVALRLRWVNGPRIADNVVERVRRVADFSNATVTVTGTNVLLMEPGAPSRGIGSLQGLALGHEWRIVERHETPTEIFLWRKVKPTSERLGERSTQPSTGYWYAGEIVPGTVEARGSDGQHVSGWRRRSTGAGHAAGADWLPLGGGSGAAGSGESIETIDRAQVATVPFGNSLLHATWNQDGTTSAGATIALPEGISGTTPLIDAPAGSRVWVQTNLLVIGQMGIISAWVYSSVATPVAIRAPQQGVGAFSGVQLQAGWNLVHLRGVAVNDSNHLMTLSKRPADLTAAGSGAGVAGTMAIYDLKIGPVGG